MADAAYGADWRITPREARWRGKADEVQRFQRTYERWPSQAATDTVEKLLAKWLNHQRHDEKRSSAWWTNERAEYLDRVAPGWRGEPSGVRWRANCDSVGDFYRSKGRWPSTMSPDGEERRLGVWLAGQRDHRKRGSPSWSVGRESYLNEVAPGWRGPGLETRRWKIVADEVGLFLVAQRRWPSQQAADKAERRLGLWLRDQRRNERNGYRAWTSERGEYLDKVVSGWRLADPLPSE